MSAAVASLQSAAVALVLSVTRPSLRSAAVVVLSVTVPSLG
jgi:hypothetical protein